MQMDPSLDSLPKYMLREILYKMKVKDVLNYCKHSKKAHKLCDKGGFWEGYIDSNYDANLLVNVLNENVTLETLDEVLLDKTAGVYEEGNFNPGAAVALYLENSKIIKYIHRRWGIPKISKSILISGYDYLSYWILDAIDVTWLLYGDDIVIYLKDDRVMIEGLKGQSVNVKILNNSSDPKIKDITVNGLPLLEQITTWDVDVKRQ